MNVYRRIMLCALAVCLAGGAAQAQSLLSSDRGYVFASIGMQPTSTDVTRAVSVPVYDEIAVIGGNSTVKTDLVADIGGAWAVGQRFLVGASYALSSGKDQLAITGQVPNPLYTDRPRAVAGESDQAEHIERTLHLNAIWRLNPGSRIQFSAFGGPSIIWAKQELASQVDIVETGPPFTEVTADVTFAESKATVFGYNVGGDVTWMFASRLGTTGFVRYTMGKAKFPTSGGEVEVDVGGLQVGAGVRWFF